MVVLPKPLMPKYNFDMKGSSHNKKREAFSKVKCELYKLRRPPGKREMASVKKTK